MLQKTLTRITILAVALTASAEAAGAEAHAGDAMTPEIWAQPSGQGVSLGYESGSWGGSWSQGVRIRIPILEFLAIDARGIMVHTTRVGDDRLDAGARLDLIGHSPVLLNLLRLYGGGGPQLFHPISSGVEQTVHWGGGGHFGLEAFFNPRTSIFFEVGGQSGVAVDVGTGATVLAGMRLYPF
ncbi:MAG: hypothetical protein AAGJ19_02305 [Myxococcota bacterium]